MDPDPQHADTFLQGKGVNRTVAFTKIKMFFLTTDPHFFLDEQNTKFAPLLIKKIARYKAPLHLTTKLLPQIKWADNLNSTKNTLFRLRAKLSNLRVTAPTPSL